MLGIHFDTSLYMAQDILKVSEEANWKVRTILRTNRFYNKEETMNLYKSRVLGYIEYRTSAFYHAAENLLQHIDTVQVRVCKALDVSMEQALMEYNLAPLNARRDISMLGLIHRSIIGAGPDHFSKFFVRAPTPSRPDGRETMRRHSKQVRSLRNGKFLQILSHSVLGLIDVYNLLPEYAVQATSVKLFQHRLQEQMKAAIMDGGKNWSELFSPRRDLHSHELRKWQKWVGTGKAPDWLNDSEAY